MIEIREKGRKPFPLNKYYMKTTQRKVGIALITFVSIYITGCGKSGPSDILETAPVRVEINYKDADLMVWNTVSSIVLRVTGYNFSPIVDTQSVDSTIFFVDTPTGDERVFTALGIDTNGVAYLWGRKDTSVIEKDTTKISIELGSLLSITGDSILILRDSLPWGLSCTDLILDSLSGVYKIIPSDSFANLLLSPLKNIIIIPSDQPRDFYDNYASYVTKFNNFVYDGGIIFFSACDKGWNSGNILEAGILFPSGTTLDTVYQTDTLNLVTGTHPIVSDLDTLRGYFASYSWFTDCPPFAQVLTVCPDTVERPTLLLYQYGSGLVLLSSQPLEYEYANGIDNNDIGILLPRILSFLCSNNKRYAKPY